MIDEMIDDTCHKLYTFLPSFVRKKISNLLNSIIYYHVLLNEECSTMSPIMLFSFKFPHANV